MIQNDQNTHLNVGDLTKITKIFRHDKSRKHYEYHCFFFDELKLFSINLAIKVLSR